MRARVAALATAVLTAAGMLAAFTPGPATVQNSFPAFQAYANGTKQHVRVVDAPPPGGQTLANVDTSFSAAAANSQGLQPINNTFRKALFWLTLRKLGQCVPKSGITQHFCSQYGSK